MQTGAQPQARAVHSPADAARDDGSILDALGVGLLIADDALKIVRRNQTAARLLAAGGDLDQVFTGLRFQEPFQDWRTAVDGALTSRRIERFDAAGCEKRAAEAKHFVIRCAPIIESGEPQPRLVAISIEECNDPSAATVNFDVNHRLTSLGKLASKVAHELNNPLDGILRYVNLSLRLAENVPSPELRSYLKESRDGLGRMAQIISDLLAFSRSSDGQFEESTVAEVVEQAVRSLSEAAVGHGVIVAMDLQERDMPIVRGSRLYQICCNLIKNAIDAMPDGGRLAIVAGMSAGDVVIRVSDSGVGLPPDAEKIFDLFFTTKRSGKGTGLGLAISKEYVEDMGGVIDARPNEPKGTVFTVRLPAAAFGSPSKWTRHHTKP